MYDQLDSLPEQDRLLIALRLQRGIAQEAAAEFPEVARTLALANGFLEKSRLAERLLSRQTSTLDQALQKD